MSTDGGGFAFPGLNSVMTGIDSDGQERFDVEPSGGMTLRDYFAAKAMQGLIASNATYDGTHDVKRLVLDAFLYADAMIAERAK